MKKFITRFLLTLLALSVVLIVVFFAIQKKSKELNQQRIALVDNVNGNYIFRGNSPLVLKDGEMVFANQELKLYFNNILQQKQQKLLNDYYLIDVNLMDLDHYYSMKKEREFFTKNPQYGQVFEISTLSAWLLLTGLFDFEFSSEKVSNHYNFWITNTLNFIHDEAQKQSDKPVVVYVHCNAGRDRTGLITASYRMLFQDFSLSKTKEYDVKEVGRSSEFPYDRVTQSYCHYVQKKFNKSQDYCN